MVATRPTVKIGCGDGDSPCANAHSHGAESTHDHSHGDDDQHHHHGIEAVTGSQVRPLAIALVIAVTFMLIEVIGGVITGSLALLADAGHMLTDSAALMLSLIAGWLAQKPATAQRTFGYRRAGVIAAFVNAAALFLIAIYITWEAIGRVNSPPEVGSRLMLAVAVAGLIANIAMLKVLSSGGGHTHDLNTRSARLHVMGDFLGSIGAIAAAGTMLLTGWYLADPILSIVVSILILRGAAVIFRDAIDILLDAAPTDTDAGAIGNAIVGIPGVSGIHDLHIWTVSPGVVSLTGHIELAQGADWNGVLHDVTHLIQIRYGIGHITLQPEHAIVVAAEVSGATAVSNDTTVSKDTPVLKDTATASVIVRSAVASPA